MAMAVVRDGVPDRVTLGVAVAIPEPFASELQRRRAAFGDPQAHSIPTHVTLLPPTQVACADLAAVHEHLRAAARGHRPFRMTLRGTGSFRPVSKVVFVQVAEGIAECELIERQVRAGLLDRELAFYYHPHVTVAHDIPEQDLDRAATTLADFAASFDVDSFSAYRHGQDGVWRVDEVYALTGTRPPEAAEPLPR